MLATLLACFLLSAKPYAAWAVVLEPQVERFDAKHVVITWAANAPVDIYVSARPNTNLRQAKLLSLGNRDGRYLALLPEEQRPYFLLRDTGDGAITHVAERILPLEHGSNFRDLGGYETTTGRHIRWGMIYRSGATPMLSDSDVAKLHTLGIRSMVDLRSTEERALAPSRLAGEGVRYVALDYPLERLLRKGANQYRDTLTSLAPQYRAVFQELLSQPGGVEYNCTAGQDRTGIATALLLSALGVPRATILQDYHLSTGYRRPENEMPEVNPADYPGNRAAELFAEARRERPNLLYANSGRSQLIETFDEIDSKWGSVDKYLSRVLEIGPAEIAKLRAKYLE